MKSYQIAIIVDPAKSEEELNEVAQTIEQHLAQESAEPVKKEVKLNQRLAYPIDHKKAGHYLFLTIRAPETFDVTGTLSEAIKTNEAVLRHTVTLMPFEPAEQKQPESVIEQLREQQRSSRTSPAEEQARAQVPSDTPADEKEEAPSVEEIDKKIEELLK